MRIFLFLFSILIVNSHFGQTNIDTICYADNVKIDINQTYKIHVNWGLLRNTPELDTTSSTLLCSFFEIIKDSTGFESIFIYVYGRNYEEESLNSADRKAERIIETIDECNPDVKYSVFPLNQYLKADDYKPIDSDDPINNIYILFK